MTECYKVLWKGGQGELVEKKSRFIATTKPVETEEEAIAFIESMKKQYWDASHNCSAYVIGDRSQIARCSDDGEPGQTAGRPMLDVLMGEEVRNACVVVTRYFGGTLLGTGGLVRAYGGAAKEGLRQSQILEKCLGRKLEIGTEYTDIGKIQYILAQNDVTTLDTAYTDQVTVTLVVPVKEAEHLKQEITEGTGGRARIVELEQVYYGRMGKETLIF